MKRLITLLVVIVLASPGCGQVIGDYDLGGASKPKPDLSFRKEKQYKRVHQSSLRFILRGELDKTESFLNQFLDDHPNDAETLYMLGILHGQRGNVQRAERSLNRAIQAGLPADRLVAGPRSMMQPLMETRLLRTTFAKYAEIPVHGPLLGNLTEDSCSIWVRTATESDVSVFVHGGSLPSEPVDPNSLHRSDAFRTSSAKDFTAVAVVDGLKPETDYYYAIRIDDGPLRFHPEQKFRTFRPMGESGKISVAFGGGAGYVPQNERMWNTIAGVNADAILLLGDNVYIDDPESVVMQQYTYHRRQSRPEWRALTASTPVYTIWDDHDFSTNDSWGGPDIDIPFWKKEWAFPIFRQNWVNPGYGGGDKQPGCWYSFHIGDVDFIMLDCRYYRTNPRSQNPSMLGPVQKRWLKDQLLAASGTFKVLCSSVPWDFRTKGDSRDTWNGYKQEHEEVLHFIEDNGIEGVVLMSADRHRSDAWKIERERGYGFYEFNSSRLTNQHVHPTMEKAGAIFSYNNPQSFGLVTFDTAADDPSVTYEVVNINGERPHWITVKRSELTMNPTP